MAPEHLAVAILDDDGGAAIRMLTGRFGVSRTVLRDELVRNINAETAP